MLEQQTSCSSHGTGQRNAAEGGGLDEDQTASGRCAARWPPPAQLVGPAHLTHTVEREFMGRAIRSDRSAPATVDGRHRESPFHRSRCTTANEARGGQSELSNPLARAAHVLRPPSLGLRATLTSTPAPPQNGHAQSLISGMSSPCSTMYSLCSIRLSRTFCFAYAAMDPSFGTRSITSATR